MLPCCRSGRNSANFTVGLTNSHPLVNNPQLGSYDVCGQYPGTVPRGATVKVQCTDTDLPPARYVIVQFPTTERVIFCEVEVYTPEGWTHLYRVCQKSDTLVNYVNIMSYKLKDTRYLHCLNNFNISTTDSMCPPCCCTTRVRRRRHSSMLRSMKRCDNLFHSSTMACFS